MLLLTIGVYFVLSKLQKYYFPFNSQKQNLFFEVHAQHSSDAKDNHRSPLNSTLFSKMADLSEKIFIISAL